MIGFIVDHKESKRNHLCLQLRLMEQATDVNLAGIVYDLS